MAAVAEMKAALESFSEKMDLSSQSEVSLGQKSAL